MADGPMAGDLTVRPLHDIDLPEARIVHRRAFGAFLGIPAENFRAGADCLGPRWRMWRQGGIAAFQEDKLVGSALLTHWGSACILGPLTVEPDVWGQGVARRLTGALLKTIDKAGFRWTGLFTHAHSPTHIRLYEENGFCMQRITAIQSKPVDGGRSGKAAAYFSELPDDDREKRLNQIGALGETVSPGLDWRREVTSIAEETLGDTVLLIDDGRLDGFACIHCGENSEATEGQCLVKVGAVSPGPGAPGGFARLLDALENAALRLGASRLVAGANTGRAEAYRMMKAHGYRTDVNGVAMLRPATDVYNLPGSFVIDDWR